MHRLETLAHTIPKLEWEYSRNQRKHYVHDGEWYRNRQYYLWEIDANKSCE